MRTIRTHSCGQIAASRSVQKWTLKLAAVAVFDPLQFLRGSEAVFFEDKIGGASRDRTDDLIVANDNALQLRHRHFNNLEPNHVPLRSENLNCGSQMIRQITRPDARTWEDQRQTLRTRSAPTPEISRLIATFVATFVPIVRRKR